MGTGSGSILKDSSMKDILIKENVSDLRETSGMAGSMRVAIKMIEERGSQGSKFRMARSIVESIEKAI